MLVRSNQDVRLRLDLGAHAVKVQHQLSPESPQRPQGGCDEATSKAYEAVSWVEGPKPQSQSANYAQGLHMCRDYKYWLTSTSAAIAKLKPVDIRMQHTHTV